MLEYGAVKVNMHDLKGIKQKLKQIKWLSLGKGLKK